MGGALVTGDINQFLPSMSSPSLYDNSSSSFHILCCELCSTCMWPSVGPYAYLASLFSARDGERTLSHEYLKDGVYHIIDNSQQEEHLIFLSLSAWGSGWQADIVNLDIVPGQTLYLVEFTDLTCRDLREGFAGYVGRGARKYTVDTSWLGHHSCHSPYRRKVHCLLGRTVFGSLVRLLCTRFCQWASIMLQRSETHAIHVTYFQLE